MIPTQLIKKALALTGKNIDDMNVPRYTGTVVVTEYRNEFSIEKFMMYLLSPEFIEKYANITEDVQDEYGHTMNECRLIYKGTQLEVIEEEFKAGYYNKIGGAIYEFQNGDSKPLIYLLSKI